MGGGGGGGGGGAHFNTITTKAGPGDKASFQRSVFVLESLPELARIRSLTQNPKVPRSSIQLTG